MKKNNDIHFVIIVISMIVLIVMLIALIIDRKKSVQDDIRKNRPNVTFISSQGMRGEQIMSNGIYIGHYFDNDSIMYFDIDTCK